MGIAKIRFREGNITGAKEYFEMAVIGFPESAVPGQVPGEILFRLGVFYGPIAAIPGLISAYCYGRYRIDRDSYERTAAELRKRNNQRS